MKITCPKCNTKYRLNEDTLKSLEFKVKCSQCQYTFVIKIPKESVKAGVQLKTPEEESVTLWRIRLTNGLVYGFNDSDIIKNWITENKVNRHDEVCYANGKWQKIEEVPTFKKYFEGPELEPILEESPPDTFMLGEKKVPIEKTSLDENAPDVKEKTEPHMRRTAQENIPEIVIDAENPFKAVTNLQFKNEAELSADTDKMNEEIPLPMDTKPEIKRPDVRKQIESIRAETRSKEEESKPKNEPVDKKNLLSSRWIIISLTVVVVAVLGFLAKPLIISFLRMPKAPKKVATKKVEVPKPKDPRQLLMENSEFEKAVDLYRFDTITSFQLAENGFLKLFERNPHSLVTGKRALNFAMWGYVSGNAMLINQALELLPNLDKQDASLKEKTLALYYVSKEPTPENVILLKNSLDSALALNEADAEVYYIYGLYYLKNAMIQKAVASFVTALKYDELSLRAHRKLLEIAKTKDDTVKINFHEKVVNELEAALKAKYPELNPQGYIPSSHEELTQNVKKKAHLLTARFKQSA